MNKTHPKYSAVRENKLKMTLLLGPVSVGKTLLLKRLHSGISKPPTNDDVAPVTIPTVGTNLVTVNAGRRGEITVREVGGSMAPIWPNYYKECSALIFMSDMSNRSQVAASCVLLCELLNHDQLQEVPVLILLNKIDESTLSRPEFDGLTLLNEIIEHAHQKVTVLEVSAKTGQSLNAVTKWLQDNTKAP